MNNILNTRIPLRTLVLFIFALGGFFALKGEGSKELAPNANTIIDGTSTNDVAALHIGNPTFNNFASFDNTNVNSRLHIHISDPLSENILLGFSEGHLNATSANPPSLEFVYRILDPNGNIVFGPTRVTGISANINNWAEAVAGPSQLVGTSGYDATQVNALDLTSGGWTTAGDYYIEFSNLDDNGAILIDYWDITVVENSGTALTEKKGRVWSYNWALFAINDFGFPDRPFNGSFYVCAPDVLDPEAAFVTQIDFNNSGFRPAAFNIAFNSFGTLNTGNIVTDRQSRENVNSAIPEYAIFLNDPVDICETAESGGISILGVSRCDSDDYCIKFISTRSGQIDLLLDFDGQDDVFTAGTADVMITQSVSAGDVGQEVCLPWDGRDGLGNVLLEETTSEIPISLSFAQGIYHFPIYDAELMTNGFAINNIRPTGPEPLLYYDDSQISVPSGSGDPQVQLMGCDLPCHNWTNYTNGGTVGFGNLNTINSWWFSQQTMNTETLFLPSFYACNIAGVQVACEGDDVTLELISTFSPDDTNPASINNLNWTGPGIVSGNGTETISIDESGTYEASFSWQNNTGDDCETACNFEFELLQASSFTIDTLLEFDQTLEVNSITYDADGTYTQVLTAVNGCDSILTIIVDINMPEVMLSCNLQGTTELCEGETGVLDLIINKFPVDAPDPEILDISWTLNGSNAANNVESLNVSEAGQYTTTITYVNFMSDTISEICSIIVSVYPTYEIQIDTLIGDGDIIDINGMLISSPGQFIDSLSTEQGCDSIVIVNVIQETSVLYYSLDDCKSSNYDLFVPEYPSPLECAELDASIVYRVNEELNRHSCTPGIDGGVGLCVSSVDDCNYLAGDDKTTIIELLVTPGDQEAVQITSLNFYERAPEEFQWVVGTEGLNNYPTRFGIRVLKNGQEIYRNIDIGTSLDWTLQNFNFASLPEFKVQEPSFFRIELLAYCLIGNDASVSAWDIDEISLKADCAVFESNTVDISGTVNNTINEPIQNVRLDLKYGEFDFQKFETSTDLNGEFAFENISKTLDYNLRPVSGNDYMNGISTLDLIHIQRHILGIEQFDTPYKMIAADVDKSKNITVLDVLQLRKLILGIYDELPQNESWRYVQSNQELHVSNPWNIKETTELFVLNSDKSQSFVGVKIGDVSEDNSSFKSEVGIDKRSLKTSNVSIVNESLIKNKVKQLSLSFDNNSEVFGYQFSLKSEGALFIGVENDNLYEGIDYVINEDKIIFSIVSAEAIELEDIVISVMPLISSTVDNAISIDNSQLTSEIYTDNNEVLDINLNFVNEVSDLEFEVSTAYPNPFNSNVQIGFNALENQKGDVVFYDITGTKISQKSIEVISGVNQLNFESNEFGDYSGLIIYEIRMKSKVLSGRMIKN